MRNKWGCVVLLGNSFTGFEEDFPDSIDQMAEYNDRLQNARTPKNYHTALLAADDVDEKCWYFKDWYGPEVTTVKHKYSTLTDYLNWNQHASKPSEIDRDHEDFNDETDYLILRGYALYFEPVEPAQNN